MLADGRPVSGVFEYCWLSCLFLQGRRETDVQEGNMRNEAVISIPLLQSINGVENSVG